MANNSRALRFKKNAEEFDQKLSDIKRLVGTLGTFINDVTSSLEDDGWRKDIGAYSIHGDLVVRAQYVHKFELRFEFWHGMDCLSQADLDIEMVRCLHDNLDILIIYAESICRGVDRLAEFQSKLARFGF